MIALTRDDVDDLLSGLWINALTEDGQEHHLGPNDFKDGDFFDIMAGETIIVDDIVVSYDEAITS